jgi:hypothetical protein
MPGSNIPQVHDDQVPFTPASRTGNQNRKNQSKKRRCQTLKPATVAQRKCYRSSTVHLQFAVLGKEHQLQEGLQVPARPCPSVRHCLRNAVSSRRNANTNLRTAAASPAASTWSFVKTRQPLSTVPKRIQRLACCNLEVAKKPVPTSVATHNLAKLRVAHIAHIVLTALPPKTHH